MKVTRFWVLLVIISLFVGATIGQSHSQGAILVSGTVKFGKAPVVRACVQFTDEKNQIFSTISDGAGKYRIELPAGRYNVYAVGGPNPVGLVGFTPELYKKLFLVGKRQKVVLNILVNYVGEG